MCWATDWVPIGQGKPLGMSMCKALYPRAWVWSHIGAHEHVRYGYGIVVSALDPCHCHPYNYLRSASFIWVNSTFNQGFVTWWWVEKHFMFCVSLNQNFHILFHMYHILVFEVVLTWWPHLSGWCHGPTVSQIHYRCRFSRHKLSGALYIKHQSSPYIKLAKCKKKCLMGQQHKHVQNQNNRR